MSINYNEMEKQVVKQKCRMRRFRLDDAKLLDAPHLMPLGF